MMFQNLGGAILLSVAAYFSGDLAQGAQTCIDQGFAAVLPLLLFAGSNFIGAYFVLSLNKRFGAVIMTLTSTARKAVQMALSFVFFPDDKEFRLGHALGGVLFLVGLCCFNMAKQSNKKKTGEEKKQK